MEHEVFNNMYVTLYVIVMLVWWATIGINNHLCETMRVLLRQSHIVHVNLFQQGVPGVVESLKIITREKSYRIAKYAFDYATRHKRNKVTAIHKANIM